MFIFSSQPGAKNYWAPLGFTHSIALISSLRSDENEREAGMASSKEVRVEFQAAEIVKDFPASMLR